MRYMGFLKKEFREIYNTRKKIVLTLIFFILGMTAPLLQFYLPVLLRTIGNISNGRVEVKVVKEAKYLDSYAQFFDNFTKIGTISIILVFMGIISSEKVKGTISMVLTKPVSHLNFILSKFVAGLAFLVFSYLISIVTFILYNFILFPDFKLKHAFIGLGLMGVYLIFLLAVMILASTITKSGLISAGIGGATAITLMFVSKIPSIGNYLPGSLNTIGLDIIKETRHPSDMWMSLTVTCFIIVLLITSSVLIFKRQEI